MDILRQIERRARRRLPGPFTEPDGIEALTGQFLIAMPGLDEGPFARAVIYVCSHSDDGAMGLVVNHAADRMRLSELMSQLDVIDAPSALAPENDRPLRRGGPVETSRGFVLHSPDLVIEGASVRIDEDVALSATLDMLQSIAEGRTPERYLLALGYAGWSAGQLEDEIQSNSWLTVDAPSALVFNDPDTLYDAAMSVLGVDPARLSAEAGHA